jgi:hypothetical protein
MMKRLGILLIVAMFGLVLACGSQEEKAPAKSAAPPATGEKVAPPAAPAAPTPSTPAQPKPEHPKSEHPK